MKTAWNDKDHIQHQEAQSSCTEAKAAGVDMVTDTDTTFQNVTSETKRSR